MRLILSILAGLLILTGSVRGMRLPFNEYIDVLLEGTASVKELLQYLQQQDNGYANYNRQVLIYQ